MNSSLFRRLLPHLIAAVIFLVVAVIYCQPALQGKVLDQHDVQGWRGTAQQSFEYKEKYGHYLYWVNNIFSGMPGYQIAFETPNKISIGVLHNYIFTLGLPKPINYFFLASIMAYFLLMVLRVNPWIGVMGALAYAYSTFDSIIIFVGHDTQMICLGYAPAVLASLLLIFQRKYILGTVLTALFAAMIVWQNHIQITYYTMIIALAMSITYAIVRAREGMWREVAIAGGLAIIAAAVAFGVNTINIWPMNEYAKETMRGGRSELTDPTSQTNKTKGGLDKDYAFHWSYGQLETFTFVVPRIFGGSSGAVVNNAYRTEWPAETRTAEVLSEKTGMGEDQAAEFVKQFPAYWGTQPSTSGPVYLGAIICFLFIVGLVYVKSWHKWWIIAACLFAIILAWGKNLPGINYFLFDHMPLYNKFRAPTMALVIPQLCFPVLACLGLQQFLFGDTATADRLKKFKLSMYIIGGVFLLLALMYLTFDYAAESDKQIRESLTNQMMQQMAQGQQQPNAQAQQQAADFGRSVVNGLHEDRKALFRGDLIRSFALVALAAGLMFLYVRNKIKPLYVMIGILVLVAFDLLNVGRRYLNYENFVEPTDYDAAFIPNNADIMIKRDPAKHFRVFDQTAGDPFSDSRASYHHNNIGGYSPAKLALYDDIIKRQLLAGNMNVYNMLNTKYFITANPQTRQPEAQLNPGALGNVWFVKGIRMAKNADDEMSILPTLNTKDTVVIDQRFQQFAKQPQFDSTASISLIENINDKVTYQSNSNTDQFAVFSEVYYPHGWDAYIDGKKTEYARVNYVLRGMPVPAGKHNIEFRFEPRSVILGDKITMWFNILIYLMLGVGIYLEFRNRKTTTPAVQKR